MGIEKIKEKILEDANLEAKKIIGEAEKEKEEILNKAKEEAEKRKNEILKKGEKEAEILYNSIIAEAKLQARREILEVKERIIEKAIQKLREDLAKLPDEPEYMDKLLKLIKEGAISLGGGEIFVNLNKRDYERLEEEALWKLEKEVELKTNKVTVLKKGEVVDILGGCILNSGDKTKLLDNSLEAIFERSLPKIRIKVTEKLF
ncbi:V-type proton ATPase subunit E [Methanocaldococcus infernus]|uniref:V-type proton ATPase subunit E n=1 Tax=Methanocaldococcus infernus TaxID=67760 RepID=UPI00064E3217|nr:V-type proton ATPase subunit E [Methanocaldococcus infernus]